VLAVGIEVIAMNGLTAVRGKVLLIDKNYEVYIKEIVTKKLPSAEASL
jgi:hypothetical protein